MFKDSEIALEQKRILCISDRKCQHIEGREFVGIGTIKNVFETGAFKKTRYHLIA